MGCGYLMLTPLGLVLAVLVQFLGTVILGFLHATLAGEASQTQYMAAMAAVLAIVQLLLLANHCAGDHLVERGWFRLWQHLLCFLPRAPIRTIGGAQKRIADYLADALLIAAAVVAWREVGSGSLSALFETIARDGMNLHLQWSAVLLVLAVVLRTAALPFHGWLIQADGSTDAGVSAAACGCGGRWLRLDSLCQLARTCALGACCLARIRFGDRRLSRHGDVDACQYQIALSVVDCGPDGFHVGRMRCWSVQHCRSPLTRPLCTKRMPSWLLPTSCMKLMDCANARPACRQSGREPGIGTLPEFEPVFGLHFVASGTASRLGCGGGMPCSLSPLAPLLWEHGSPV